VSPSDEAFVVHNETGDILYRPAGADNNWEPLVVAVVKNKREMFGLVSKKWKQISEQGRPGITRRIEDALRDTNNEWVLVNFPDETGDVMFSANFEALSPDERNTAGREFLETLKPPIEIQARSDLLNPRFWIRLLGPPISLGVPMLLIAWIVLGFRSSETSLVVGWSPGALPLAASVALGLPAGLASLVVVSSFYSGSVIGLERAA
jgi:hypothetical protein